MLLSTIPRSVCRGDDCCKHDRTYQAHSSEASEPAGHIVRKEIKARRRSDFGIPDIEATLTVLLCLPDMEDFVLVGIEKWFLTAVMLEDLLGTVP